MPGPYIRDGHYLYGSMINQPYPAYYNSSWYHRKPPRRSFSSFDFFDDGSVYLPDQSTANPNDPIIRSDKISNIINIETISFRTLRIKLYAVREEDDTDMVLELGKGYSITYITETGLKVATGILKIIDSNIPDKCTRYIGEFNETVTTAWIGLDCSVVGKSDKRKIYVASIRAIEEADITDPDYVPPELNGGDISDSAKLNFLYNFLPGLGDKLDQILIKVADNDQIMDKLAEMDPIEKLDYIIGLINDKADELSNKSDTISDKADSISDKIDAISDNVDTLSSTADSISDKTDTISDNIDTLSTTVNTISDNIDTLSTTVDGISDKADSISNKADTISGKADTISGKVDAVSDKADALSDKIDNMEDEVGVVITDPNNDGHLVGN